MIPLIPIVGTDVLISQIGFGCARLYGGVELNASAKIIDAALDAGIRHFDTAPCYGSGWSERALGELLVGVENITIATKFGIPRPSELMPPSIGRQLYRRYGKFALSKVPRLKARILRASKSLSPVSGQTSNSNLERRFLNSGEIEREIELSLNALRRDHIDLFLIHEPDQFHIDDTAIELLQDLKRQGLVRAIGLAHDRVGDEAQSKLDVLQSRFDSGADSLSISQTHLFHGVMRHGWIGGSSEQGGSVSQYFLNLLSTYQNSGFIFSASTPTQIRSVTEAFV